MLFVVVLVVGAGAFIAAHVAALILRLRLIHRESVEAWAELSAAGAPEVAGLDAAGFRRAYYRAHGPRGRIHLLVAAGAAAVATAPALLILGAAWRLAWMLAGAPEFYQPGLLIWQFYLFFGTIASWVAVAAFAMRRYHRNRPRELPYELARERERARGGISPAADQP